MKLGYDEASKKNLVLLSPPFSSYVCRLCVCENEKNAHNDSEVHYISILFYILFDKAYM